MTPAVRAAIEAAVRTDRRVVPGDATLAAVGWSTVEFDRAAAQLGVDLVALPDDVALGAACREAIDRDGPDGPALILLEPSTEGRLARALARHGEGPITTWWDADLEADSHAGRDAGPAFADALLPASAGPLGPARLLRDGARDGRFRFLRSRRAATISA